MPFYDYYCEASGRTVEVFHPIKERLKTWGQVCAKAGIEPGTTSPKAKVVRLVGGEPVVWKVKGLDKDRPTRKFEI